MGVRIKCDKCNAVIGDVDFQSHCEIGPDPGGQGVVVNVTFLRPAANYNAVMKPNGARRILCDTCKTAFDALVAGY